MSDMIRVDPANLRDAAAKHAEVADYLRGVPGQHDAIQQSLDSLGPIFGELREAGRILLEERRRCYDQQADDHAALADGLRNAAGQWELHEEERAATFRSLPDQLP